MGLFSALVSGGIMMMGVFFSMLRPDSPFSSIIKYFGGPTGYIVAEYLQKIYKEYRHDKVAKRILEKYIKNLDSSIKENVLDISDIDNVEKFLDYNFIFSQTKYELNYKKIFVNESVIDEVYEELTKNFELTKFSGLVLGDIGTGKTTLINELLMIPNKEKGLTETTAGESITLGPPIRFNNPNYYPWLVLYDTQGFDKDTNFVVSIDDMRNYIENKFINGGNEFVNFVIYCINGERFIGLEKENLIKLHNLYPSTKLQIIVLNTRGLNQNADRLLMKIKLDLEKNYNIKDIIFLSVSAIKSKFINPMTNKLEEFGTLNLDKLMNIILNITENSFTSTLYKLFLEKVKTIHKNNIDSIIDSIDLKGITDFDENYRLILSKCLNISAEEHTLNTMKTHYFKILDKDENEKNAEKNIRHLKDEYEKEGKGLLNEKIIEEYKRIYLLRVSDHAKNGTIILMKKLMNEDFIFKDIISYLEKSRKIKFYIDKLVQNFKKTIKSR